MRCTATGCEDKHHARGLCMRHYAAARRRAMAAARLGAWGHDLTDLRIANELMMAGIGGLLETHAPPEAVRRRLRELWDLGNAVRAPVDVSRVEARFMHSRRRSA